jgi:hypothetical protein
VIGGVHRPTVAGVNTPGKREPLAPVSEWRVLVKGNRNVYTGYFHDGSDSEGKFSYSQTGMLMRLSMLMFRMQTVSVFFNDQSGDPKNG